MLQSIIKRISFWFSMAEVAWKFITFLLVLAGFTTTALIAKGTELFGKAGSLGWIVVGLGAGLVVAIIMRLVASASHKNAEAEYVRAMSREKVAINPLSDSFVDRIIPIEDLRLPTLQLHHHKQFKRCQFVGPGAIALIGGTISHNNFIECGDFIKLEENTMLTGIVVLKGCTVELSDFHRITILAHEQMIQAFKSQIPVKEGAA
jgi:hypothetical protein